MLLFFHLIFLCAADEFEVENKICKFYSPISYSYERESNFSIMQYIFLYSRESILHKFYKDYACIKNKICSGKQRNMTVVNKKLRNIFYLNNTSSQLIEFNYLYEQYYENIVEKILEFFFSKTENIFISSLDFFYAFKSSINFFNASNNLHNFFNYAEKEKLSILFGKKMHVEYEKLFCAYLKSLEYFLSDWIGYFKVTNKYLCDQSLVELLKIIEDIISLDDLANFI